jgi:hypothetical protein
VLAKWLAESKSVYLGLRRFETCRQYFFFSIGTDLDVHSWILVSSEVYSIGLSHVVAITELKSAPHGLSRFETCRQQGFFYIGTDLDIHSWILVISEVYPTFLTGSYRCGYHNRIKICFP